MTADYEKRYCAFVDILGFRGLMTNLRKGTVHHKTIRDLLKQIHAPFDPQIISFEHSDFRAQSISDAVALSTKTTIPGLEMLFSTFRHLAEAALHQGYFIRGSVCKGLLYHDDQTVFGDALIEAYRLESEIVKYPRIMLTKAVFDDAMASQKKDEFSEHIRQAEDGPYYVNVLWRLRMLLDVMKELGQRPSDHQPSVKFFGEIRDQIQKRFDESVDTPAHFEKIQWFANYWNVTVADDDEIVKQITGPGLFRMRFLST